MQYFRTKIFILKKKKTTCNAYTPFKLSKLDTCNRNLAKKKLKMRF